jgi:hypothetical protein
MKLRALTASASIAMSASWQMISAAPPPRRSAALRGSAGGRPAELLADLGAPGEGNPVHCGLVTSPTPALAHPVSWPDSLSRSADSAVCSGGLSVTVKSAAMAPR